MAAKQRILEGIIISVVAAIVSTIVFGAVHAFFPGGWAALFHNVSATSNPVQINRWVFYLLIGTGTGAVTAYVLNSFGIPRHRADLKSWQIHITRIAVTTGISILVIFALCMVQVARGKVRFPLRITIIAPFSDTNNNFGISYSRGIMAGLMQTVAGNRRQFDRMFKLTLIDESPLFSDRSELRRIFESAQINSDVVFGPLATANVEAVLEHNPLTVTVPTIIYASFTGIRDHEQFGKLLVPLGHDVRAYVEMLMRFCRDSLTPPPEKFYCLYRGDAFGRAGYSHLIDYPPGRPYSGIEIPWRSIGQTDGGYRSNVVIVISSILEEIRHAPRNSVVFVFEFGMTLEWLVSVIRSINPEIRIASISATSWDRFRSGHLNGVYFVVSYIPGFHTTVQQEFRSFCARINNDPPAEMARFRTALKSTSVGSLDAEGHDFALYWFERFVSGGTSSRGITHMDLRSLLVTPLVVSGHGKSFSNMGQLYVLQASGSNEVPRVFLSSE